MPIDERLSNLLDIFFDFTSFVSVKGFFLIIATLILISLLNMCSPLEKKFNYFLGTALGFISAYIMDIEFLKAINYLILMLMPWMISYAVFFTVRFLKWLLSSDVHLEPPKPSNPYYNIDSTRRDPKKHKPIQK
jgi:hypothetical protein